MCKTASSSILLSIAIFIGSGSVVQAKSMNNKGLCAGVIHKIEGHRIFTDLQGSGDTTVVFESGFGNDSSVWSEIAPRIRHLGVKTFVYDRAGMGKSKINTNVPYSIQNDVHIVRTALNRCHVSGKVIMVGHSYGGGVSLFMATVDKRIKGLVLIDAILPFVYSQKGLEGNLIAMRGQFDQLRREAPELAKVAIPFANALPATVDAINQLEIPESLPISVIVAEKGMSDPETQTHWTAGHVAFTNNHGNRTLIVAKGSSHKVMKDDPDLVVEIITSMIAKTDATPKQ